MDMDFKYTTQPFETILPKLIRDNIPEIIKNKKGKSPKIDKIKNKKEFLNYLLMKLVEESQEALNYTSDQNLIEELGDIKEIVVKILEIQKIEEKELERIRLLKREKNGGFDKKLILLSID